jgi:antitoxin CptB
MVAEFRMQEERDLDRLRWQCRRSMLELDLLLERFLAAGYADLSQEQRILFAELLQTPDPELFEWLSGRRQPELPEFEALVALIREAEDSAEA